MSSQSYQPSNISSIAGSSKVTRVGQLMRLKPLTFMGSKVEEYPQEFVDEIENIFRVMPSSDMNGVEFVMY